MLLGEPVDVCSKDTTDSSINYFETTRRSARSPYSPLNPLEVANPDYGAHSRSFSHLRCAQCDDDDDSRDRLLGGGATSKEPRTLGGSVPLARLALAVLASLALTAGVAITVGASHKRQLATLAALKATQTSALRSAERQQKQHPRLAQLAATTRTNAALLLEDRRSPSTSSSEEEATDSSSSDTPALGGVDVVAFFGLGPGAAPVFGTPEFASVLDTPDRSPDAPPFRTTFWFSSAANRDAFAADPVRYAPRFGGFCSYGITSEFAAGADRAMLVADPTEGWPWDRDHLGPPADLSTWAVRDGKLYFAFLPDVMEVFLDDYDALSAQGEQRWAEWFGDGAVPTAAQDATTTTQAGLAGPFNVECMADGYGPPVVRTCTWEAQTAYPRLAPAKMATVEGGCAAALDAACGADQGDDPVADNACSICLDANYDALKAACPTAAAGGLQAVVDKAYCW